MKLPITRETTGCATSVTRSHVSRPSSRSSTRTVIARIASSWSAIRFGVKPRWKSAFSRSCFGGSMPMNIARASSIGKPAAAMTTPPSSEEYVSQSRLTVCTSSAVVTDQKPGSSGNSSKFSVQWIGHLPRICLKASSGGPSSHSSRSVSSTLLMSRPTVATESLQSSPMRNARRSYWPRGQFLF
jgi:hypothetical protein